MEIGEAPKGTQGAPGESDAGHTKLEDMIRELSGTLTGIKHEQEYMHVSKAFAKLGKTLLFLCGSRYEIEFIGELMKVLTPES